jgi:hypothetical protein
MGGRFRNHSSGEGQGTGEGETMPGRKVRPPTSLALLQRSGSYVSYLGSYLRPLDGFVGAADAYFPEKATSHLLKRHEGRRGDPCDLGPVATKGNEAYMSQGRRATA